MLLHYEEEVLPNNLRIFIGSFMVMSFFIASGWLSAMRPSSLPLKDFIKKRWNQLIIPYLWWTVIILLFDLLLLAFGYYTPYIIGREIYKTLTLRGIGTLWFIPALFGGEIIWNLIKNKKKVIVLTLVATIIYQTFYLYTFGNKEDTLYRILDAPFRSINDIGVAWLGIACGYHAYKLLRHINNPYLSFIIGYILCHLGYEAMILLPNTLSFIRLFCTSMIIAIGLLMLLKPIQNLRVLYFFDYWGRNSLNLMVTHYSITLVFCKIIVEKIYGEPFLGNITIVSFILSIPVQWLFVILINKYAKFTLGK